MAKSSPDSVPTVREQVGRDDGFACGAGTRRDRCRGRFTWLLRPEHGAEFYVLTVPPSHPRQGHAPKAEENTHG